MTDSGPLTSASWMIADLVNGWLRNWEADRDRLELIRQRRQGDPIALVQFDLDGFIEAQVAMTELGCFLIYLENYRKSELPFTLTRVLEMTEIRIRTGQEGALKSAGLDSWSTNPGVNLVALYSHQAEARFWSSDVLWGKIPNFRRLLNKGQVLFDEEDADLDFHLSDHGFTLYN